MSSQSIRLVTLSLSVEAIRRNKGRNLVQLCFLSYKFKYSSPITFTNKLPNIYEATVTFVCTRTLTTEILIKNIIQIMNNDNVA